jgi:diacylglycerol kinase family enzyme
VHTFRGSNIRIFPQENRFRLESDGENLGFGPFEFTVLPRALKVVIGEKNF